MDDFELNEEEKRFLDLGHDPEKWNEKLHSEDSSWEGPLKLLSKIANSWFGIFISVIAIITLVLLPIMNSALNLGIRFWFW